MTSSFVSGTRPDALLFDFGNVFIQVDFDRTWRELCKLRAEIPREKFYEFLHSDHHIQFELGQIDEADFFSHMAWQLGIPDNLSMLKNAWNSALGDKYEGITELVVKAAKKWPLYMFSNTNITHYRCWKKAYRTMLLPLTHIFTSHEMGLRKPAASAYQQVLQRIGLQPPQVLFFDDRQDNIAAADQLGILTLLVSHPDEMRRSILALF